MSQPFLGPAYQFAFYQAPLSSVAGTQLSISVIAQDSVGNLVNTVQGSIIVHVVGDTTGNSIPLPSPNVFTLAIINGAGASFSVQTYAAEVVRCSMSNLSPSTLLGSTANISFSAGCNLIAISNFFNLSQDLQPRLWFRSQRLQQLWATQ